MTTNHTDLDPIDVRIRIPVLDSLLGPKHSLRPDDDVDTVVESAILGLAKIRTAHGACPRLKDEARQDIERLKGHLAQRETAVERRDADIRALRIRIAELERTSGRRERRSPFGVVRLPIPSRWLGAAGVLILALVAITASVFVARSVARPSALNPDALDADERQTARTVDAPALGRVEARGFAYDPSDDTYYLVVDVTPSVTKNITFVGVSTSYSSLAVGQTVLRSDPRSRVRGVHDLDHLLREWGKRKLAIGEIRRILAYSASSQVAPGQTYQVTLAFKSHRPLELEEGMWGRVSLVFWTSKTLDGFSARDRVGEEIRDAAFTSKYKSTEELADLVRVDVTVPFMSLHPEDAKPTEGAKSADAEATNRGASTRSR